MRKSLCPCLLFLLWVLFAAGVGICFLLLRVLGCAVFVAMEGFPQNGASHPQQQKAARTHTAQQKSTHRRMRSKKSTPERPQKERTAHPQQKKTVPHTRSKKRIRSKNAVFPDSPLIAPIVIYVGTRFKFLRELYQ